MLRFKIYEQGGSPPSIDLDGAYMVGSDRVPLRALIELVDGEIVCGTHSRGAAALSILWPVAGYGHLMLETPRLVDRRRPYNLHVELARGQLMRISQKREDWGLYDYPEGSAVYRLIDAARNKLLEAMTTEDDVEAARLGDEAIAASVNAGEAVSLFHAGIFFDRRQASRQLARDPLGCVVDVTRASEAHLEGLSEVFHYASVPFSWRAIEPQEGRYQTTAFEQALRIFRQKKIPVRGVVMSPDPADLPDWVVAISRDWGQLRDAIARYLRYLLKQFQGTVQAWEVIRGGHAHNAFRLSFEQIMELTRISATLAKQLAPRSIAVIGIVMPWGEYYSQDPRTIPPKLYADMVVANGVNFDALGLEMNFGGPRNGMYVRDMLQISAMLDQFGALGKPIHITSAGVPSGGEVASTGCWRHEWSETVQAEWMRDFYRIALSKPFVESVTWRGLADASDGSRLDGVLRTDGSPKAVYEEFRALRRRLGSVAAEA